MATVMDSDPKDSGIRVVPADGKGFDSSAGNNVEEVFQMYEGHTLTLNSAALV